MCVCVCVCVCLVGQRADRGCVCVCVGSFYYLFYGESSVIGMLKFPIVLVTIFEFVLIIYIYIMSLSGKVFNSNTCVTRFNIDR